MGVLKPTPRDAWNSELRSRCPARLLQAGQPQTHMPTRDFTQCPCVLGLSVLLSSQKVLRRAGSNPLPRTALWEPGLAGRVVLPSLPPCLGLPLRSPSSGMKELGGDREDSCWLCHLLFQDSGCLPSCKNGAWSPSRLPCAPVHPWWGLCGWFPAWAAGQPGQLSPSTAP